MTRRIHVPSLSIGQIDLAPAQAHHLRDVLRLRPGDEVTAFDDAGGTADAVVLTATADHVTLKVDEVKPAARANFTWMICSAVPKGPRADWMVEKLAELGTDLFIPLAAARSVSLPEGKEKLARWDRLSAEASRQCGRSGVMRIKPLKLVTEILDTETARPAWYLSTEADATPVLTLTAQPPPESLLMLIGPEGGWTAEEIAMFKASGLTAVKLSATVLRVETAAVAAATLAAAWRYGEGTKSRMKNSE